MHAGAMPDAVPMTFMCGVSLNKVRPNDLNGRICEAAISARDVIFRKITNQNRTDTNEIATRETKYQTNFYSSKKIPMFNQI